jgi:DNA-binding MarR family transcriptional regulator
MLRLTAAGHELFAQVFPAHVAHCQQAFRDWSGEDFDDLDIRLTRLRDALSHPAITPADPFPSGTE